MRIEYTRFGGITMAKWKEIPISDIKGVKIGHAHDEEHATGCTVIVCDKRVYVV